MIQLHQMLHGYKLGHNYIQGSLVLPSSHDMDKIATLSDWAEYVGVDNKRDYITAYPLDESPFYVVAKTWYAEGMTRPGCVWTHSLLIQKEDLGKITDFCSLLSLFVEPISENENFEEYSKKLVLFEEAKEVKHNLSEIGDNIVAEIYEKMLSSNPVFFLSEFPSQQCQELLLTLFNYIPIGIIENKSFCSGTASPRSYDSRYLSLQFVTHESNSIQFLSNTPSSPWAQLVGISIVNNRFQVAQLIRHYQDELGDNVEKLEGFLNVVLLINRNCKDEEEKKQVLLNIIEILSKAFPSREEGNVFKTAVFEPSLTRDYGGEVLFLYTIFTVDVSSFSEEQTGYEKRLHALPTNEYLDLLNLLFTSEKLNDWGVQTINNISQYISYAEVAGLRKTNKVLFQTIISSSSELLNQIVWSDFSREDIQSILSVFTDRLMIKAFKHWRELFKVMFELDVPIAEDLVRMAFSYDLNIADDYLTYLNGNNSQPQLSIYKELNRCPELLLNWLSKVSLINHDVAYVLMNSIDETSSLVKTKGSRIWLPFHNYLNEIDDIQSSVFMYRISFNWQDDEALMYMRQAFYPIHKLLSKDILDYRLWYKVEPYTDHLVPWWDKCKKLRKRIIRRLKDAGYSKSVIYNYTPDSEINDWLIKEW